MDITCISDLHGHYPKLHGGDLLIVAGDLTGRDQMYEYIKFFEWFSDADYKKKIVIAGNHDNLIQDGTIEIKSQGPISYLCDSGTEFEGLKIWGSPWTMTFDGMNPKCKAFTVDTEEELSKKWDMIPLDTNILITHSPSYGMLDYVDGENVGSLSLRNAKIFQSPSLRLHVCAHIHECGGLQQQVSKITIINASHVNEHYEPVNAPVRITL